jgi:hypothetical protein
MTGKEPWETAVNFHAFSGEDFDDYRQHKFSRNIPRAHVPEQPVAL